MAVRGFELSWVKSMTFVGTVINFSGNDAEANPPQAYPGCEESGGLETFPTITESCIEKQLKLLISKAFASALWLSETWHADRTAKGASDELGRKDGLQKKLFSVLALQQWMSHKYREPHIEEVTDSLTAWVLLSSC